MAQTTHLMSFGPVIIVGGLSVMYYFIHYNLCTQKKLVTINKAHKKKKTTHLWPKQCCLGLFSCLKPPAAAAAIFVVGWICCCGG